MHRRQFLQTLNAMGASVILPASAFYGEGASAITATQTPTNAVEVAGSDWAIPKVGVVALGGRGSAIVNKLAGRLPYLGLSIAIDTDVNSLQRVKADRKILVGDGKAPSLEPQAARFLAQSSLPEIADAVAGLDMVLLVAGMGGAAGSGIAPIVAQMLREQDILTLAFTTLPSSFGSLQRKQIAQTGIRELRLHVNALLPFSNRNIERVAGENASFTSVSSQAALAFDQLWRGILNPVCRPGWVNIDFEDLRHIILSHEGDCAFGFGSASGVDGAAVAALHAIDHPLLGRSRLQRASTVLMAVRASPQVLKLGDSMSAMRSIRKQLSQDPWIIYGTYHDDTLDNEITVSVLASGIRAA
ncbi:hypothetical protein [Polaromonas sp.]|uniref:hypothetical protein n=1 Tax=Polaromonas sp. TaxID=1869339 RepID=UPI00286A54C1|nr:hypothetical protein [Polaromonas sp.]